MVELFTSTGEGFTFDSMIARFSFASTGKCNSMIEFDFNCNFGFVVEEIFELRHTIKS